MGTSGRKERRRGARAARVQARKQRAFGTWQTPEFIYRGGHKQNLKRLSSATKQKPPAFSTSGNGPWSERPAEGRLRALPGMTRSDSAVLTRTPATSVVPFDRWPPNFSFTTRSNSKSLQTQPASTANGVTGVTYRSNRTALRQHIVQA